MSKDFVGLQGQVTSGMGELAGEAKSVMDGFITLHQAATADGEMQGADVLLMLGDDKAGKTLEELNPDLANGATTQVTSPPIAGETTTETTTG